MIKGVTHIGLSVEDLDRSVEFYRVMFGMEVTERESFEGPLYERILALRGVRGNVALLKRGSLELELFEFQGPSPKGSDPNRPVCDRGITHFCVEVTHIDDEYERMKNAGVSFHCPPLTFPGNVKATYARDPDGNVFELVDTGSATHQPSS